MEAVVSFQIVQQVHHPPRCVTDRAAEYCYDVRAAFFRASRHVALPAEWPVLGIHAELILAAVVEETRHFHDMDASRPLCKRRRAFEKLAVFYPVTMALRVQKALLRKAPLPLPHQHGDHDQHHRCHGICGEKKHAADKW